MAKKGLLIALLIGLIVLPIEARAAIITFDLLVGSNGDPIATYTEDGFTVTDLGVWVEAHLWGNPTPDIFTSYGSGESQSISVTTSGFFYFDWVDLSTGSGEANYTIRGLLAGVDQFTPLTGSDAYPVWTRVFGDGMSLIDTLIITQTRVSGVSANIDNIAVTPAAVPEPTSLLLLGTGLVGLAGWRCRRA